MEKTFKTQGIVLLSRDFGESDRIFTVYTRDYGKIEVLGKGAKKILSKLNSHMAEFCLVDLMVANGSSLDKLAGAVMITDYKNIKSSLLGITLASYIAEVFNCLFAAPQKDQQIFEQLISIFDYLDANINLLNQKELLNKVNEFFSRILNSQGYTNQNILNEKDLVDHLGRGLKCSEFMANIS